MQKHAHFSPPRIDRGHPRPLKFGCVARHDRQAVMQRRCGDEEVGLRIWACPALRPSSTSSRYLRIKGVGAAAAREVGAATGTLGEAAPCPAPPHPSPSATPSPARGEGARGWLDPSHLPLKFDIAHRHRLARRLDLNLAARRSLHRGDQVFTRSLALEAAELFCAQRFGRTRRRRLS